jgi:Tlde1 domain
VGVGSVLRRSGVRGIPLGIAAIVLGFVLRSPGTQADTAETGPRGSGISVFGTIHPDIFRLSGPRLRVASLEPPFRSDAPINAWGMVTDTSPSACRKASADERFAVLDDGPASFEQRFASTDDCPASFEERFGSTMQVLASSLRQAPDIEVPRADAPPKPVASKAPSRPAPPRREAPALEDDGRIAVYDITARTVYLPSGRRLEAHSGLGDLMDNPRYSHVRMRGVTPPNVYRLTLRESLFHGVRAIRLNPIDEGRMHGRAGILAHTYMLGANGQSNGCVSFSNYNEFLSAYLRGEITHIAVVERLDSPPGRLAAGSLPEQVKDLVRTADRSSHQYAAAR